MTITLSIRCGSDPPKPTADPERVEWLLQAVFVERSSFRVIRDGSWAPFVASFWIRRRLRDNAIPLLAAPVGLNFVAEAESEETQAQASGHADAEARNSGNSQPAVKAACVSLHADPDRIPKLLILVVLVGQFDVIYHAIIDILEGNQRFLKLIEHLGFFGPIAFYEIFHVIAPFLHDRNLRLEIARFQTRIQCFANEEIIGIIRQQRVDQALINHR